MLAVGVVSVVHLPTAVALVVAVAIGLVSTCLVFRIGSMRLDPRELGDLIATCRPGCACPSEGCARCWGVELAESVARRT